MPVGADSTELQEARVSKYSDVNMTFYPSILQNNKINREIGNMVKITDASN